MKVVIRESVEVTDEQRVQLASVIDGKVSKRKATRDEARAYVWEHGESWEIKLSDDYMDLAFGDDDIPLEGLL